MSSDWKQFVDMRQIAEQIRRGEIEIDFNEPTGENRPYCPDCEGLGQVRYDVSTDDPRFGKMYPCPNPECPVTRARRFHRSEVVSKASTWDQANDLMTFRTFRDVVEIKDAFGGKRGGYAAAIKFATNGGKPYTLNQACRDVFNHDWPEDGIGERESLSLVLNGVVGTGKTGLATSCHNELKNAGESVVFIRVMDLIRKVQGTYSENERTLSTEELYKFYIHVDYLILDEFGIKNYKPDRLEIVETIIRGRDRANKPTLITTNLNPDEISDGDGWNQQIGDIVKKYHWVEMGGVKLRDTVERAAIW